MKQEILTLGLSISVLTNIWSLWSLLKAIKQHDHLMERVCIIEWDNIRKNYGTGIPSMAEDTEVAK